MNDRTSKIREALAVYADSLIEFYDQTGLEKKHFRTLIAAARAYADLLDSDALWRVCLIHRSGNGLAFQTKCDFYEARLLAPGSSDDAPCQFVEGRFVDSDALIIRRDEDGELPDLWYCGTHAAAHLGDCGYPVRRVRLYPLDLAESSKGVE